MAQPELGNCQDPDLVHGLADGTLDAAARRRAERLLERSEPCRELYRQLTYGRFPSVPNYTIIDQVGKGGFGVVYKAVHHAKERTEALKVLFSKTPLLTTYFENEVHLIARLRHPNIAILYEAQLSAPPLFYTMEFVEGERLNDYLKTREVSLAHRIEIIRKVALALAYAHEQGVVHRDVKPQNILIDSRNEPHLVDFGIAKRLELLQAGPAAAGAAEDDAPEGPVGTLGYIAPEQGKGGEVDARADVYSVGALLFHCVTGEPARLARDGPRCLQVLRARRIGQAEDLAAIIARCVESDPARRYQTTAALAADLQNYLEGRETAARRLPTLFLRIVRILALMIRNKPYQLRFSVLVMAAVLAAAVFWGLGARLETPRPEPQPRTVLVRFDTETEEAIRDGRLGADLPGLSFYEPKSYRVLHGKLLERLAAGNPRVIVFDYIFPDAQPEFDPAFVEGIRKAGAPVVVGVRSFDINGEPEISEALRGVIHSYGSAANAHPRTHSTEFEVLVALQRGFEDLIPSLSLAGFACWRFPDSDARLRIENPEFLEVRYLMRRPVPGRSRWQPPDLVPLQRKYTIEGNESFFSRNLALFRKGDVTYVRRVAADIRNRIPSIPYQDVFSASDDQLRAWFGGKAVLIGQMLPRQDMHQTTSGAPIWGCEVQVAALDSLLATEHRPPVSFRELILRAAAWALIAGILVTVTPVRRVRRLRVISAACGASFLAGLLAAVYTAMWITDPWLVHSGLALSTMLIGGGLAFLAKAVRDRQLQLTPQAIRYSPTEADLPSTIVAR